jgi:ubiquinone/menaquinone biosynthesis C-methylase UbiE
MTNKKKEDRDSPDFSKISYILQRSNMDSYTADKNKKLHSETWFNEDTIDAWRHNRMKSFVDPILTFFPKARWLTVGDGRYGTDAHYLIKKGAKVLATDISMGLLKVAKRRRFITDFKRENAEKLSFKDGSFDFVFCKESFHHFPRPMVALYEMLRVAKKGVILIEPHDSKSPIESFMVKVLRKANCLGLVSGYFNIFEESGNYVYKLSERELEKIAIGLQLESLAFAGLDDFYIKGVEYEKPTLKSIKYLKIKLMLFVLDLFYKLGIRKRSLLIAIVFKVKPNKVLKDRLRQKGFKVYDLPKNPYLK